MIQLIDAFIYSLWLYAVRHAWSVFWAVVLLVVGGAAIQVATALAHRLTRRIRFERTAVVFLERSLKALLWIALVLTILATCFKVNIAAFVAGLGMLGFVIGFATKDVFANLAAGLMLMISRPFNVDDRVDIGGIAGRVDSINISTCIVITDDHVMVIVPNSRVYGTPIKNFSRLASPAPEPTE